MNARLQEISNDEYEDYLNEAHGKINICGNEYDAGDILRQIDPVAFDIGKQEYEDSRDIWICDNCNREYDNEEDAESCCRNHDYTTEIVGSVDVRSAMTFPFLTIEDREVGCADLQAKRIKKSKPWIVDLP